MLDNALIGYSGFVGSNIKTKFDFTKLYNSSNIEDIEYLEFDTVVCAGSYGGKWKANKYPQEDWQSIKRLIDSIQSIKAKRFILISTIDVYVKPNGVNESSIIDIDSLTPYGKHRRALEIFVERKFNSTILRLPTIFGEGMRKGVVYDLMHNQYIDSLTKNSEYQYYFLDHIWEDIEKATKNDISLLNIATEPITIGELNACIFHNYDLKQGDDSSPKYNMFTEFSSYWGKSSNYLYNKMQQLNDIRSFKDRVENADELKS